MAFLTGILNTTNNDSNLNARSFAGTILRLYPNGSAPLFALTSKTGRSKAKQSTHGYFSKTISFFSTTGTGSQTNVATTLNVGSTTGLLANMVLYNTRTFENIRVLTIASATSITCTRAFGRVAAAALNDGDKLIAVGSAFAEGSTRPTARSMSTVYIANYTQIFRNAWGITDTMRASLAEAGYVNVTESRKDCAILHSAECEAAIIWGQPKMDTSGTQPVHATQGIIDAIRQYCTSDHYPTAGATTSYSQLVTLVEGAFQYSTDLGNPKERIGFCDSKAMKVMHEIGRASGQIEIMQDENSFGMQFTSFKFYKGTIHLMEHPLMNALNPAAGDMLVVDMPAIKLAYMEGRDTKPEEYGTDGKIVENGTDGVGGSLTTEFAVEFVNPYSAVFVKGLTAGAAS